jgi:hypothetical protein
VPPQTPQNLTFLDGKPGTFPPGWTLSGSGYTAEQRENCGCAVIVPPAVPDPAGAELGQKLSAVLFRGTVVHLKASLRVDAEKSGRAQLWIRVNHRDKPSGLFDNLTDEPVRSADWTLAEIRLPVGMDADSIEFGVKLNGGAPVWIRDVSLEVPGKGADSPAGPVGPVNLGFSWGESDHVPLFWSLDAAARSSRPVVTLHEGCHAGSSCVVIAAPYAMLQSFGAQPWRGKIARLRAWVRVEGSTPEDQARVWLRSESAVLQRTAYRDSGAAEWTEVNLVYKIGDDALNMALGITVFGGAKATVDGLRLDVVPDAEALPGRMPVTALLPDVPVVDPPVSAHLPVPAASAVTSRGAAPSLEEQKKLIHLAADRATAYAAGLPNFVCTEVVERSEKRRNQSWRRRDLLTIQLGYADREEHYKLVAVNNRPASVSYLSIGGAVSQGEFGSIMREMFQLRTAQFEWDRRETLRDRSVDVFSYRIKKEKSGYMVQYGATVAGSHSVVVAHHGFVYIDRGNGDVLRMVRIAELPARFPVIESSTILDYAFGDVGGRSYLLPLRAQLELSTASLQTRNEVQFRDYRRFEADSSITFDKP